MSARKCCSRSAMNRMAIGFSIWIICVREQSRTHTSVGRKQIKRNPFITAAERTGRAQMLPFLYVYKIHSNHSKRKLIEPFQLNDLTKDKRPSPQRQSNALYTHLLLLFQTYLAQVLWKTCKLCESIRKIIYSQTNLSVQCNCLTHYEHLNNNNQSDWNNWNYFEAQRVLPVLVSNSSCWML